MIRSSTGELVAKLMICDDEVCCDYSKVYLKHDDELIAVQPICWEPFPDETDEACDERISRMPMLPFGCAKLSWMTMMPRRR